MTALFRGNLKWFAFIQVINRELLTVVKRSDYCGCIPFRQSTFKFSFLSRMFRFPAPFTDKPISDCDLNDPCTKVERVHFRIKHLKDWCPGGCRQQPEVECFHFWCVSHTTTSTTTNFTAIKRSARAHYDQVCWTVNVLPANYREIQKLFQKVKR